MGIKNFVFQVKEMNKSVQWELEQVRVYLMTLDDGSSEFVQTLVKLDTARKLVARFSGE